MHVCLALSGPRPAAQNDPTGHRECTHARVVLASNLAVERQDEAVFLVGEAAVPELRAEVVEPAKTAALTASFQP
jgi:hypothetical protein